MRREVLSRYPKNCPPTVIILQTEPVLAQMFIERDPVEGFRPSATLLFGSLSRGGMPSIGAVLTGMGEDGAKGLKLLQAAGFRTLAQDRTNATVPQAPAAAVGPGAVDAELKLEDLAADVLANCGSQG